ncbi:MAG: ATP-binding protein [Flavobacteriales bacterium]|nr:ATP-binding protein [Flavobacteriales bacterium]
MIIRLGENYLQKRASDNKALIILGARQVGKTTLLKKMFPPSDTIEWLTGDDLSTQQLLENINLERWKILLKNKTTLVIDEAQRIKDIGLKVKLVLDHLNTKVVLSGSSSLELANSVNEPLTGRKWEMNLYPISFAELVSTNSLNTELQLLHHRLVFGQYPDVINHSGDEIDVLTSLSDSYLYKDILSYQKVRKPEKLKLLLSALAHQLGSEVSYNELGKTIGLDNQSIELYIDLLEKNFIVFRLPPLSRNLRKELKSKRKIYFWDNGIRNAIIAQFQPFELRADKGQLWENWFISERLKHLRYSRIPFNSYFWRTQDQQEIDLIEDKNGVLSAFEIKWNSNKKVRFSKTFLNAYPSNDTHEINPTNFYEYLV